jgi:hypothetical protein
MYNARGVDANDFQSHISPIAHDAQANTFCGTRQGSFDKLEVYLGGIVVGNPIQTVIADPKCRPYAHVMNSPQIFRAVPRKGSGNAHAPSHQLSSPGHSTLPHKDTINGLGLWVKNTSIDCGDTANTRAPSSYAAFTHDPRCVLHIRTPQFFQWNNLPEHPENPYGFEYVPSLDSRYKFYSYKEMQDCRRRLGLTHIFLSGDSIINGLHTMLTWIQSEGAASSFGSLSTITCDIHKADACVATIQSLGARLATDRAIMVMNFAIQHVMAEPIEDVRRHVSIFVNTFQKARSAGLISSHIDFILLTATATHGFRNAYLSMPRAKLFSDVFVEAATSLDWFVIDLYGMSYLIPEASYDGMHYHVGLNFMIVQMILNHVC